MYFFVWVMLLMNRAYIQGILEENADQIDSEEPPALPSLEPVIPVHENEEPEGIKE